MPHPAIRLLARGGRPALAGVLALLACASAPPSSASGASGASLSADSTSAGGRDERVLAALESVWVHGVTEEVALAEIGPDGIGAVLRVLRDPAFGRRDNAVAFLAWLGGDDAVSPLLAMLASPPGSLAVPEEDRALMLVPQALGRLAARGSIPAIDALLDLTAAGATAGSGADLLATAAATAPDPAAYRRDLLEAAIRGLGIAADGGETLALERLEAIARGDIHPGNSLERAANAGSAASQHQTGGARLRQAAAAILATTTDTAPALPVDGHHRLGGELVPDPVAEPAWPAVADSAPAVHDHGIGFANHVDVASPMTNARADEILALGSLHVGRADFAEDVTCCATFHRSAPAASFGVAGDGLDVIDNEMELLAVLSAPGGRVKVVRQIKWCGSAGTNIVGCAWNPGEGMVVVRLTNASMESLLWVHEYGHNTGLPHNDDSRYVMYPALTGSNAGIEDSPDFAECTRLHAPSSQAKADMAAVGACDDADGDGVHDLVDNCPEHANAGQADADGDGIGDACECVGVDTDGDDVDDCTDNCPDTPNVGQADADGDGIGDACDPCPLDAPDDDDDGDGTCNSDDACPDFDDSTDSDGDGVPDGCDICPGFDDSADSDGDGVPDGCDICPGFDDSADSDGDGVPDGCDTCSGFDDSVDSDGDGVPDGCDPCPFDAPPDDGDGDGTCDSDETLSIHRGLTLTSSGTSPPLAEVFDPSCATPPHTLCGAETVNGPLDGLVFAGEARPTGTPSLWLYQLTDDGVRLARSGDDIVTLR